MITQAANSIPSARNYVLVDLGYGVPEAYTVHLDGQEVGYMRVRAGMARAQYKGETVWEYGEDVDRSSNASYFAREAGELAETPLLHAALRAIDQAYCADHPNPSARVQDVASIGYELIPHGYSND